MNNEPFKYMNSCGHNSVDGVCIHKCPKSVPIYNVKLVKGVHISDGVYVASAIESEEPEPEPE